MRALEDFADSRARIGISKPQMAQSGEDFCPHVELLRARGYSVAGAICVPKANAVRAPTVDGQLSTVDGTVVSPAQRD